MPWVGRGGLADAAAGATSDRISQLPEDLIERLARQLSPYDVAQLAAACASVARWLRRQPVSAALPQTSAEAFARRLDEALQAIRWPHRTIDRVGRILAGDAVALRLSVALDLRWSDLPTAKQWHQRLGKVLGRASSCQRLRLQGDGLPADFGRVLGHLAQLATVHLAPAKLAVEAPLAGLRWLSGLTDLRLSSCRLPANALEALRPLQQLRTLELVHVQPAQASWAPAAVLPQLQVLSLFAVATLQQLEVPGSWQHLQVLSLQACPHLAQVRLQPQAAAALQVLNLADCSALCALPQGWRAAEGLQELEVRGSQIDLEQVLLQPLSRLMHLNASPRILAP